MDDLVPKGECWEPWRVLLDSPVIPTKDGLKQTLFLGSGSLGDAREIFQGDGSRNQCVAVAINGGVAQRLVSLSNGRDELLRRAAAFISQHDPFGDHFSARELANLDPDGGYVETFVPPERNDANDYAALGLEMPGVTDGAFR